MIDNVSNSQRSGGGQPSMKRKWLRRLAIAGGALVLTIAAAVLAGKYWLVPVVLRQQISAALREQWDGQLTIGAVNFNWTGPSYLQDVELRDAAGREWLRAKSVKLTTRDWPGLHPALGEVAVEGLDLQGYFTDGALQLPLKPAPLQQGKNEYVDLCAITIRNMSIGITVDENALSSWDGLQLTVHREGQSYRVELMSTTSKPGEELSVKGTVEGGTLEVDLNIVMQHTVTQQEADVGFTALNAPFITQADGKIDVKLDLRGRLSEFPSCSTIRISGAIALADGSVSGAGGPLIKNLSGEIRFDGQAPLSAAGEWSASICQGQAKGKLRAIAQDGGAINYRYRVDADNVNFDEIVKALGHQTARRGTLQFICAADGHTGDRNGPVVKGYMYLADAHLGDMPLLTGLFNFMGISQFDEFQSTDVEATFTVKGLMVTISKARVANAIAAIDVEPGGQVDIEKHYIDMYAIVAPVKQLHDVLASIPLVKLVVHQQDKLMRVRIHGDWDAEPMSLISSESFEGIIDIGKSTVGFISGVVSSGGRIGKTLYNEFGERFDP